MPINFLVKIDSIQAFLITIISFINFFFFFLQGPFVYYLSKVIFYLFLCF